VKVEVETGNPACPDLGRTVAMTSSSRARDRQDCLSSTESVDGWQAAASNGYTAGMKTAVSIPDDVFEKVERFARRSRRSRSEVFSAALREYMARHAPDEVTEAINRAVDEIGDQTDEFVAAAARRVLEKTEW